MPLLDEDYLILSTIHSAKGQEWKTVHVLNGVDGCIPSDMASAREDELEEERRLLYVAMTRARDHLTIMLPQRFYVQQQAAAGDRHVYASPSRFLTVQARAAFDQETWPIASAHVSEDVAPPRGAAIDLGAQIRAAWTVPSK